MRRMKPLGFTLLELLMVVLIVAIIATIALPQYFRTVERSRAAEALQVLSAVRSAQMRYYAQWSAYVPGGTKTELDISVPSSTLWNYDIEPTSNIIYANRNKADANWVGINVVSGATCTSQPSLYQLNTGC